MLGGRGEGDTIMGSHRKGGGYAPLASLLISRAKERILLPSAKIIAEVKAPFLGAASSP